MIGNQDEKKIELDSKEHRQDDYSSVQDDEFQEWSEEEFKTGPHLQEWDQEEFKTTIGEPPSSTSLVTNIIFQSSSRNYQSHFLFSPSLVSSQDQNSLTSSSDMTTVCEDVNERKLLMMK